MKKNEAIVEAIEEHGSISDVSVIHQRAMELCGDEIDYTYVINVRSKWREESGIIEDCRTYKTQKRRNMLNDDIWDAKVAKPLVTAIRSPKQALKAIKGFHSIDQLRTALDVLVKIGELKAA